ncbi:MAG: hypothetical protein COB02_10995 [Candidatus Cloacimonadota bacterium]|nr:MAG: hypothetical protein COB02_10995 [Candidatus Cloacimonadota bacterium]
MNRKVTPKVKNGLVQKKNNHSKTKGAYNHDGSELLIFKYKALKNYSHVVSVSDLHKFISIFPDFKKYSEGLHSIILDGSFHSPMGLCEIGVISLMAWEKDSFDDPDSCPDWLEEHKDVLTTLGVEFSIENKYSYFTKKTARDFMLIHVFVHEIGHHYDRWCTYSKNSFPGGEPFAENFANNLFDEIWPKYQDIFYK